MVASAARQLETKAKQTAANNGGGKILITGMLIQLDKLLQIIRQGVSTKNSDESLANLLISGTIDKIKGFQSDYQICHLTLR
ncbi:MAG TPA: hypothetical protein DEF79_09830 [Gammaproteobacteria bacterium]|nr:hypothetical protein [Gammaproteobacteria bacterium]